MGKRKRHHPQDVKDYLSYCMKMYKAGKAKTDIVVKWYFLVLEANGLNPMLISHDDPEYGEGGSIVFPEDWISDEKVQ